MKKVYINPKTEIINIELQQMIAMSNLGSTEETSGNLSRGDDDIWADDEYDEEW